VPFAVVLGEDEVAQGKVKIKEMGLREGHPEKEGVLVDLTDLVRETKDRLARKRELDEITRGADGLRVVHGIKGEDVKADVDAAAAAGGEEAATAPAPPTPQTAVEPTTTSASAP
jgi:histidyl-tRNA synthetase